MYSCLNLCAILYICNKLVAFLTNVKKKKGSSDLLTRKLLFRTKNIKTACESKEIIR